MVKVSNEDGVSRKLFNCCSLFSLEIERVKWNVAGVNGVDRFSGKQQITIRFLTL